MMHTIDDLIIRQRSAPSSVPPPDPPTLKVGNNFILRMIIDYGKEYIYEYDDDDYDDYDPPTLKVGCYNNFILMIIIDYGKLGNHYHPEFQKKQHNRKNSATKRLSAQNMMIKLIIITMTYSEQNMMIKLIIMTKTYQH